MRWQMGVLLGLFSFFAGPGLPANSNEKSCEWMSDNLDIIKSAFSVKYAPADWKMASTGWDLDRQISEARSQITPHMSLKEYQRLLLHFFNSTRDYHVSVQFFSSELAYLPFRVQGSQGRYFVAWVDNAFFKDSEPPLKIGDEILSFDGKSTHEAVLKVKEDDFGNPDSLTDQALAEASLTLRMGSAGQNVPSGRVPITVQRLGEKPFVLELEWFYLPEEIHSPEAPACSKKLWNENKSKPLAEHPIFHKKMATPLQPALKKARCRLLAKFFRDALSPINDDDDGDDGFMYLGAKKSFVPELGKVLWRASANKMFHAYLYELPKSKRKIAYLRIPNYDSFFSLPAQEFGKMIALFQKSSDALVIDQVDNNGGDFFYLYAIASMLSDYPLDPPTQRLTITQEDVAFALEHLDLLQIIGNDEEAREFIGPSISGYKVDLDFAKGLADYFQYVISEWNSGHYFTSPCYMFGIGKIKPNPSIHYTKPILFLVNSLSFSAADYLPAILQDNKRAVIFGARTAGAGGFVQSMSYPNLMGINFFTYTASFAERPNREPIENLGVVPDIIYEITPDDLQCGYKGYVSAVNKAVAELLKRSLY